MEPGPVMVHPGVVQAMMRPAVHHLSEEFVQVMDGLCLDLAEILDCPGEVSVIPSSGRGGLEAVLNSAPTPGRDTVIVSNGSFGRMLAATARTAGHAVTEVAFDDFEEIDVSRVSEIVAGLALGILAVVHNESSTGMLNRLGELADIAHSAGGLFLVDAVSSAGGADLSMRRHGIDFCVTASQKALGALAGLSIVGVSETGIDAILKRDAPVRHAYFDLKKWWDLWLPRERGGTLSSGFRRFPNTMATHLVFALEQSCSLLLDEGIEARVERHAAQAAWVRGSLRRLGVSLPVAEPLASPTLTAMKIPGDNRAAVIIRELHEEYRITVAGGLDSQRGSLIRIGHMGEQARPGPLLQCISALEKLL